MTCIGERAHHACTAQQTTKPKLLTCHQVLCIYNTLYYVMIFINRVHTMMLLVYFILRIDWSTLSTTLSSVEFSLGVAAAATDNNKSSCVVRLRRCCCFLSYTIIIRLRLFDLGLFFSDRTPYKWCVSTSC